jgi:hypothetical protein
MLWLVGNGNSLCNLVIPNVGGRGVKSLASDLKSAVAVNEEGTTDGDFMPSNLLTMLGTIVS